MDKGDFREDAEDSFREPVDLNEVVSALEDLDVFFEKIPMIVVAVVYKTVSAKQLLLAQSNCREGCHRTIRVKARQK